MPEVLCSLSFLVHTNFLCVVCKSAVSFVPPKIEHLVFTEWSEVTVKRTGQDSNSPMVHHLSSLLCHSVSPMPVTERAPTHSWQWTTVSWDRSRNVSRPQGVPAPLAIILRVPSKKERKEGGRKKGARKQHSILSPKAVQRAPGQRTQGPSVSQVTAFLIIVTTTSERVRAQHTNTCVDPDTPHLTFYTSTCVDPDPTHTPHLTFCTNTGVDPAIHLRVTGTHRIQMTPSNIYR